MSISVVLDLVTTAVIVAGLGFAVAELRRFRRQRQRESLIQLTSLFQTTEFQEAIVVVLQLPDGLDEAGLRRHLGDDLRPIHHFLSRLEGIGMLVGRGEIALEHVDWLIHGPILIGWEKLRRFILDTRQTLNSPTWWEWVQWLAEAIAAAQTHRPPAYEAHEFEA